MKVRVCDVITCQVRVDVGNARRNMLWAKTFTDKNWITNEFVGMTIYSVCSNITVAIIRGKQ